MIAAPAGGDLLLCQITSRQVRDGLAIPLEDVDFEDGGLRLSSNVRPNRIFTAERRIVLYKVGRLRSEAIERVTEAIIEILRG